jgi:ABC-2 type transport system ATP-binding protein
LWPDAPALVARLAGVGKAFCGRLAVAGLDFRLARGEILGLVGANGGGKTTTLRLLAGLLTPDSGEGEVLGVPLRPRSGPLPAAARRRLGYMAQATSLYGELTVAENLRFHAEARGMGRDAAAAAAARFGLGPRLADAAVTLSGGWARRAHFAAAVLHAPELLLLDEPTAGLDIVTRRELWRWIDELAAAGTAIVVSTHDLADVERLPRLLFYDNGRVQGPMTPAALRQRAGAGSLEDAVAALAGRP